MGDFSDEDWVVVIHDNDDVKLMNSSALNLDSDFIVVQGCSGESKSTYADILRRPASDFVSGLTLPLSRDVLKHYDNFIPFSCLHRTNTRLESSIVNEPEFCFKLKSPLRHHYTVIRHKRSERFYKELSHCRRKQYNRFPGCGRNCRMERRIENLTRRKDVRRKIQKDTVRLWEEWKWGDDEFDYE